MFPLGLKMRDFHLIAFSEPPSVSTWLENAQPAGISFTRLPSTPRANWPERSANAALPNTSRRQAIRAGPSPFTVPSRLPLPAAPPLTRPPPPQLIESGEKERLKQLLRRKLPGCGWRDDNKEPRRG